MPVGTLAMMESVSELLEAYGLVGRAMCSVAIVLAMEPTILGGGGGVWVTVEAKWIERKKGEFVIISPADNFICSRKNIYSRNVLKMIQGLLVQLRRVKKTEKLLLG